MKKKVQFPNAKISGGINEVSPDEFVDKKTLAHIVDVRQPEEFTGELGHIPGSILIPLSELPHKLQSLPKDETIVFVCRSGGRSANATQFAKQNGFQDVYNLYGGMLLWNRLSLEVEF